MRKYGLRTGALLLCMLFMICAGAFAHGNILQNPEISVAEGAAQGWTADAWDVSRSVMEADAAGMDGNGALYISSATENDARFVQTVSVDPDTDYRLACYVKADCSEGGAGANISVGNSFARSDGVFDTQGEWVLVEMYGKTGPDQTEMDIYLRLGGYSAVSTGEAWFDCVTVEHAHDVPEGAFVQDLSPFNTQVSAQEYAAEEEKDTKQAGGTLGLVTVAVLFALASAVCYVRFSKSVRGEMAQDSSAHGYGLWILLFAGLAVRLITAANIRGFETDINCFLAWSGRVVQTGFGGFYSPDSFCDYMPGYIYVLWIVGLLRTLLGQTGGSDLAVLIVKLPNIAADLIACAMLWRFAKKKISVRGAWLITALYAFNPAVVLDSAGWGQSDGLLSMLLIAALIFAADKKWVKCLAVYALAVLAKPQALLFAPLGVLVLLVELARSRDKKHDALTMLGGLLLAVGMWIGLSMPISRSPKPHIPRLCHLFFPTQIITGSITPKKS